jgi:hypothetical protein
MQDLLRTPRYLEGTSFRAYPTAVFPGTTRKVLLNSTPGGMVLAQVRHGTVERPANSFRISSSDGKVCTTFGIGFQPFWNV